MGIEGDGAGVGLQAFVSDDYEVEPIMRTIAKLAIRRKFTLNSLAQRWNKSSNSNLGSSNVRRHFTSTKPGSATVARYAEILDVSVGDLYVLAGEAELTPSRVGQEIHYMLPLLTAISPDFEPEAIAMARKLLKSANDSQLRTIATQHWRASHSYSIESVVEAFDGIFDLRGARLKPASDEMTLWGVWQASIANRFPLKDADAMVTLAVGLLRRRGIDTTAMEIRLEREKIAQSELFEIK